jgi:hypothetical protein
VIAEANKTNLGNHVMIFSVVVPNGLPSIDTLKQFFFLGELKILWMFVGGKDFK